MDRQSASSTHQAGVTLIEQIMVLVIVAALMAVALPPMSRLLVRVKLQTAQMDLIGAMQKARATAVISGKTTILCPTRDGQTCRTDMKLEGGWLLAHEVEDPDDHQPRVGHVLYVGSGYGSKLRVYGNKTLVRFDRRGWAETTFQTVLLCSRGSSNPTLAVVVDRFGRVRGALADRDQTQECSGAK